MIHVKRYSSELEIRTLHDNGWWIRTQMLVLLNRKKKKKTHVVGYTCLGEKSGLLLIKDNHQHVYTTDILMSR